MDRAIVYTKTKVDLPEYMSPKPRLYRSRTESQEESVFLQANWHGSLTKESQALPDSLSNIANYYVSLYPSTQLPNQGKFYCPVYYKGRYMCSRITWWVLLYTLGLTYSKEQRILKYVMLNLWEHLVRRTE